MRIVAVSFLNTRPLIYGLEAASGVALRLEVPSKLAGLLEAHQADACLLPVIDLCRCRTTPLVLPAGCIASAGQTFTVRVFSRVQPERIDRIWADTDSHTSVALAQVLWRGRYGRTLEVLPLPVPPKALPAEAQAVLLIGDKVVTAPPAWPVQLDLGQLWQEMTALPFVFAVWAASKAADAPGLHQVLDQARRAGQDRLEEIAAHYGPLHGWPVELARRYLTVNLQFDFTSAHQAGMEEFLRRAAELCLVNPWPLSYFSW